MGGSQSGTAMDDAARTAAAMGVWQSERGFSAAVLVVGWLLKVRDEATSSEAGSEAVKTNTEAPTCRSTSSPSYTPLLSTSATGPTPRSPPQVTTLSRPPNSPPPRTRPAAGGTPSATRATRRPAVRSTRTCAVTRSLPPRALTAARVSTLLRAAQEARERRRRGRCGRTGRVVRRPLMARDGEVRVLRMGVRP